MTRIYRDQDADIAVLAGRTIGVIGYGNQGRAQAQNMRDAGLDVIVGSVDDRYKAAAVQEGFDVLPIDRAARRADVVLMLIPDEIQPTVFQEQVQPNLAAGDALCFASGYNVHYGRIVPQAEVDVILVAPRMIGQAVRNLYLRAEGFPCLVGVAGDASGNALQVALGLAKAIGGTRLGAFESSFREETVVDLFAEQMLWPGIIKLCLLYFEKLVANGCDPEVVASELHLSGEFVQIARAMITEGFFEQLKLHSHTSQYGQLSRADRMAPPELVDVIDATMAALADGQFADEWAGEQEKGLPTLKGLWEQARQHPLSLSEGRLQPLRETIASWVGS